MAAKEFPEPALTEAHLGAAASSPGVAVGKPVFTPPTTAQKESKFCSIWFTGSQVMTLQ